jgi:hypothetical protein
MKYDVSPEDFGQYMMELLDYGVKILGGVWNDTGIYSRV